jgi:radical SAM superfamily enzyme YgiQ (UPF0313 family)
MKKGTNVSDARRVAKEMHELGMTMGGYILFGYPGEEWEDIEKTIAMVRDIAPVDYSTSVAYPMPGTEFHDLVKDMMTSRDWAEEGEDALHWRAPYSAGYYRIVESLLHAEYDLGLEFSVRKLVKSRILRAALMAMRAAGDGKDRLPLFRNDRFRGWRGLRRPEQTARHRAGHASKSERLRSERRSRLFVVS